jgi:nitrite reductase/ring-hydroxylating ferredoxin subunit
MQVLDRSTPTDRNERFVRVASLDELRAKRMMVVKGERCPIVVVCHDDRVYALDNRCPRLGFPLHRGSVADGILTCPLASRPLRPRLRRDVRSVGR